MEPKQLGGMTELSKEKHIFEKCAQLGVRLIPKSMAAFVPIRFAKSKAKYDVVLLDDDDLTQMSWKMKAAELNMRFLGFTTYEKLKVFRPRQLAPLLTV